MESKELTQNLVQKYFTYSNGVLYWKISPRYKIKIGDSAGNILRTKFGDRVIIGFNGKSYFRSRLIFLYHHGYLPEIVDHEDRNPLNDKIENLRSANPLKNAHNRTPNKNSASKYKGVTLRPSKTSPFQATIDFKHQRKYIGVFRTEAEAALAYNREAVRFYGEFANLNIIVGP